MALYSKAQQTFDHPSLIQRFSDERSLAYATYSLTPALDSLLYWDPPENN